MAVIVRVVGHSVTNCLVRAALHPLLIKLPAIRSVLPCSVVSALETYYALPFRKLRDRIVAHLPDLNRNNVNWTFLLTTSILEEIAFRYFLQTFLLAKVAKSARIVLTSTMFALVHIVRFGHFRGMLGHQFLSGLYFSVRREQSASITELSAIHFMMNAYSVYLNGGLIGK